MEIFLQNMSVWFYSIFALLLCGAIGSLLLNKSDKAANYFGNIFAIVSGILAFIFSVAELVSQKTLSIKIATSLPNFSVSFNADLLSAFFMFIVSIVAICCSIYALGYVSHYYKKYNIGTLGFFYNLFLAGVLLVVTADNAMFFLVVWEIMSLASYFLVVYENREESSVKAGMLYFIMTHVGTAFILFSFLLLYKVTGSFDFSVMARSIQNSALLYKNLIFISAFIGFGIKAGIIPLHIWLPSAHPAAPSHVSALMSGVMIKTGIYMMARIFIGTLTDIPLWWGLFILTLGSISSLLGVLYALAEHDLKRLLAYHSIENIGIILLGLGASMVFVSYGMLVLAAIALSAALFHTLNHAIFKALLFLSAGSVISETHTRNIEEYGGLIRSMPQTAIFFLIGSMAISALPPFNGFFSEWLTFQSLFSGISSFNSITKVVFIVAAGSLAFTGGLAAACFVKAFGATFLARPRSEEVKHAHEVAVPLRLGSSILALLTIIIGVSAGYVTKVISNVVVQLRNINGTTLPGFTSFTTVRVNGFSTISMPMIFLALTAALATVSAAVIYFTRKRKIKTELTWDCGTDLTPRMEITATSFSRSIISVFANVLRPTRQHEIEYHDTDNRYFPKLSTIHLGLNDVYHSTFYRPLREFVTDISERVRKIQSGNMNTYILYIFITLIGLLYFIVR